MHNFLCLFSVVAGRLQDHPTTCLPAACALLNVKQVFPLIRIQGYGDMCKTILIGQCKLGTRALQLRAKEL